MTTEPNVVIILNLKAISKKISHYLRENPATAFILAFQALLLVATAELIEGNVGGANMVGVYSFAALIVGVALHAISVIKGSKEGKANP